MYPAAPPSGGAGCQRGGRAARSDVPREPNTTLRNLLAEWLRPSAAAADRRLLAQSSAVFSAHRPGSCTDPVLLVRARRNVSPTRLLTGSPRRRIAPRLTVVDVSGAHHDVLGWTHAAEVARVWSQALAGAGEG